MHNTFRTYQTAASESLRKLGTAGATPAEREQYTKEAVEFSSAAYRMAGDNPYFKHLAMSQYMCALGMRLISDA